MNRSTLFFLLLAGALAVLPVTGLFAQTADPAATPSVSAPAAPATTTPPPGAGGGRRERMKEAVASLTPAERQELKAARQKAKNDPAVEAARGDHKAHRKAMYEAMIKADPNVKPILDKIRADMHSEKEF